ncbi:MAG: hypothetical protein ABW110_21990 [Steroidobacteraceae bacterium]
MPYEVIALDRQTALESAADIRQIVLATDEGDLDGWPRIPVQISDLDQLSDVLDGWGVKNKPSQLDVEQAVDRHAVWIGRGMAVRLMKGARWDR